MTLSPTSRTARRIAAVVWAAGVFGVASCSAGDRAISQGEMRKLAGSPKAVQARKEAEKHLVGIVQAYDKDTPLTLALVTVNDYCKRGSGGEWPSDDDTYKVRCVEAVTGYYGAEPNRIGDVLNGVLSAGDRHKGDGVAFGHDDYRSKLVDYYRGHGPNPQGPHAPEPVQLSDGAQTLDWDTVRTRQHRTLIEEPPVCAKSDPPATRCSQKPESRTVADIRSKYGMVFKVSLTPLDYYKVSKEGKVYTNW